MSNHHHGTHQEHASVEAHTEHTEHAGHTEHPGHTGHGGPDEHQGHGGHGGHQGHGGHAGHAVQFGRLFWIMLALAIPTIALSSMFAMIVGYSLPDLPWLPWISPILGTVMYVWGGSPFLTGAASELRSRAPGMMLLIALAITVAYFASLGASLGIFDHELDFWWELALLVVIMLLGHWIEMRSLARTTSALDSLAALLPDSAERVDQQGNTFIPPAELQVGDLVLIRPGGRIPADGTVDSGEAEVDESMITGESRTVSRSSGDRVVAGTVATDSALRVRVTAVGADTALAGIQRLVAEAQNSTSRAQRIADKAAAWLFWFALGSAVITAAVWTALGSTDDAVIRTITVLVIACPHALGLAIPLVVAIATEKAAKAGVLVKDRLALEAMRKVDTVLFDKTGTLTRGAPVVTAILTAEGDGTEGETRLLQLAAAAEADSEHPLARAIMAAAVQRGIPLPIATSSHSSPAIGVVATVDGEEVRVGGLRMLAEAGLAELGGVASWRDEGATILHVVADGTIIGAVALSDAVRDESAQAVRNLRSRGIDVMMLTGDAEAVAASVAETLGIRRFFAGVRPEDKAQIVATLRAEGRTVAMVGDGVNDAPALATADVGIAIGAGTEVAIASAGVILAGDDPRAVLSIITLSKASFRKMMQNLWWAAGYNLISVPLAAGVLAPIGFVLPMSIGAILMSLSTIVVAANAQLLRRVDLAPASSERERAHVHH